METSPLQVKGCKFQAFVRRVWRLSRQGSLSCHTCCNKGPRSFRSHPKDHPIQSPCMTCKGYLGTILINPDLTRLKGTKDIFLKTSTNHQHCKLKYNSWSVFKSTRFWGCNVQIRVTNCGFQCHPQTLQIISMANKTDTASYRTKELWINSDENRVRFTIANQRELQTQQEMNTQTKLTDVPYTCSIQVRETRQTGSWLLIMKIRNRTRPNHFLKLYIHVSASCMPPTYIGHTLSKGNGNFHSSIKSFQENIN